MVDHTLCTEKRSGQEKTDDASLLTAAAGGDRRAFERIYLAYKDDLLTLAALMLGDRQAAEDVLHDVFVALARRIGQLMLSGSLKGYLLTSCANRPATCSGAGGYSRTRPAFWRSRSPATPPRRPKSPRRPPGPWRH